MQVYTILVQQLVAGHMKAGYLSQSCDEVVADLSSAGRFDLSTVAAILPSLDYGSCQLVAARVQLAD